VAQLLEALRYKPEGCGFDCNFSLTSFRPHYDPGVNSASTRNDYQEYFLGGKGGRCVWPTRSADCLEIWEPQTPEISELVHDCNGIALPPPVSYLYLSDAEFHI
jgi:hypothetical protein